MRDIITICKEPVKCSFCGREILVGEKMNSFDFLDIKDYYCSSCVKELFEVNIEDIDLGGENEWDFSAQCSCWKNLSFRPT